VETVPKLVQVVPPTEYCQVPFPDLDVIAIPLNAPVSTSDQDADDRIDETRVPADVVSSLVPVKVTVVDVIVGASFTSLTAKLAVAELELKAVVPPRKEMFAVRGLPLVLAVPDV
jgi:hypothetical protein